LESVYNSGLFTYFDVETQRNIDLLYSRLRSHNKHLEIVHELYSNAILMNKRDDQYVKKRIEDYELNLTEREETIKILE
jgi:hypothetical protein